MDDYCNVGVVQSLQKGIYNIIAMIIIYTDGVVQSLQKGIYNIRRGQYDCDAWVVQSLQKGIYNIVFLITY